MPLSLLSAAGSCFHTATTSPEAAYGTLLWAPLPQETLHGMAMTRGKKRPMSAILCLLLAATSCFAKLSEFLFYLFVPFCLCFVLRQTKLPRSHFFLKRLGFSHVYMGYAAVSNYILKGVSIRGRVTLLRRRGYRWSWTSLFGGAKKKWG